jgi:hypothetical protein
MSNEQAKTIEKEIKLFCLKTAIEICQNRTTYKVDESTGMHYCYSLDDKSISTVYNKLMEVVN